MFVCFSVRAPGKYHTTIYPYIHQTCNNRKSEDQVRSVVIPDVDPTDVPPDLNFSMAAGDFLEVYTEEGTVSLSMYLILAKGLLRIAPHEVARSITTPGRGGGGGGCEKKGTGPFQISPTLVLTYATDDRKRLF